MNTTKDLSKILFRTWNGRSIFLWALIFSALLVKSIERDGLALYQIEYLFSSVIVFLIFIQLRICDLRSESQAKIWDLMNINGFGLVIFLVELNNG